MGCLYSLIFHFSAQDGEESGSLSRMVSEKCAELLDFFSGSNWSAGELAEVAERLEHPVRKLAHFSEYACMGILVFLLWSQWMVQGKRLWLVTVVWVLLSAAGDEFHQYFVPDRCASPADVLLDTCGGICGMIFCRAVYKLHCSFRSRKRLSGRSGPAVR